MNKKQTCSKGDNPIIIWILFCQKLMGLICERKFGKPSLIHLAEEIPSKKRLRIVATF
jgi:hypothetical protein